MIYELFYPLKYHYSWLRWLNVLRYVPFRTIMATITAMLITFVLAPPAAGFSASSPQAETRKMLTSARHSNGRMRLSLMGWLGPSCGGTEWVGDVAPNRLGASIRVG